MELAERYDISCNTLYNWRSRYYEEHGLEPTGQGIKQLSEEEWEIVRLKKQLCEAELERDILKKAICIFSKDGAKSLPS